MLLDATDYVQPSLEIPRHPYPAQGPRDGAPPAIVCDTIADNAGQCRHRVLGGARVGPRAADLRWIGAIVMRNGEVEETGRGRRAQYPAEGIDLAGPAPGPSMGISSVVGRDRTVGFLHRPVEARPGDAIVAGFRRPFWGAG